jgi:hypothetical protein
LEQNIGALDKNQSSEQVIKRIHSEMYNKFHSVQVKTG